MYAIRSYYGADSTRLSYALKIALNIVYGFISGETSQYEPRLFENINPIEPPHNSKYHLTEDMAEKAIEWMRTSRTLEPGKPFFIYFTPGAVHGPHQIFV